LIRPTAALFAKFLMTAHRSDVVVVGEVPGDDGEDGPVMETAQAWSRQ
jgi:hypothetical protein